MPAISIGAAMIGLAFKSEEGATILVIGVENFNAKHLLLNDGNRIGFVVKVAPASFSGEVA